MINQKLGVSLTKRPAKGYETILAVGLEFNGAGQMGEREVALPAGVWGECGGVKGPNG